MHLRTYTDSHVHENLLPGPPKGDLRSLTHKQLREGLEDCCVDPRVIEKMSRTACVDVLRRIDEDCVGATPLCVAGDSRANVLVADK